MDSTLITQYFTSPATSEMDFPLLGAKEVRVRTKGRRHAAEAKLHRELITKAIITKHVEDPDNVLGKRRKARLASESSDAMAFGVPYSMNRKGRWESADAEQILSGDHPEGADVDVVEEAYVARGYWGRTADLATAVHCRNDDGTISTAKPNGYASNTNVLRKNASKKRKEGRRSARNSQNEQRDSAAESETEENPVKINYTISRMHANVRCGAKKGYRTGPNRHRNLRRAGAFQVDPDDIATASEMEASMHDESNTYKPSRDFRFCLADYMQKPTGTVEMVRRQSVDEKSSTVEPLETDDIVKVELTARPGGLLDISSVAKTDAYFESTVISTAEWHGFNFADQVDELGSPLVVRWLDADRRRAAVDATRVLLNGKEADRQMLVVVLEKCKRNNIRVIVNSLFPASPLFNTEVIHRKMEDVGARSLGVIIEVICDNVKQWKEKNPLQVAVEPNSRIESRRSLFTSSANSKMLANQANVIELNTMAELLRKETEFALDTFERLSSEEWSSGDEEDLDIEVIEQPKEVASPVKVKCTSCACCDFDELFEMDECWQCRECLRQLIVTQIRTKNVPFHIALVCMDGQSPYDVLPALLPLPLIALYTRIAATEVMADSTNVIGDLTECPGCRQLAHVHRPNELNTCHCSACRIHWCVSCRSEPHWPMTCEEYKEWTGKFDKQYATDIMREQIETHVMRITCGCGNVIECGDKAELADCDVCRLEFNPQTMMLTPIHFHPKVKKENILGKYFPFHHQSVELVAPVQIISKQFSQVCAAARTARLSDVKCNDFEKKVRKVKELTVQTEKIKEMRKAILSLIENGFAWLYVQKQKGSGASKAALVALQKQFEEFLAELDNNTAKVSLVAKVDNLESAIHKTIEVIQKEL